MPDKDAGPGFIGRTVQIQQLLDLWSSVLSGVPGVAVVCGGTGMGKTALLEHFLAFREVRESNPTVLLAAGAAWEQDADGGVLQQLLARHRSPGRPSGEASDTNMPATVAGAALLAAVNETDRDGRPLIIWLDDLQWADVASLRAILYMLRRAGAAPLLTLLCWDPDHGRPDAGCKALLDFPGAARIELVPLSPAEVQDWSREHLEQRLAFAAARALVEHTAGKPSLTMSLIQQFPAAVFSGGPEPLPAPTALTASVASSLRGLPPEAAALVEAASVLGHGPQLALAGKVAEIPDPVRAMEAAESAGLLRFTTVSHTNQVMFPAPVIRSAVYSQLALGRRTHLHAIAARLVPASDERLRHRSAATLLPDADLVAELEQAANDYALTGAWGHAADAYLRAAGLNPSQAARETMLLKAVDAMVGAGQLPRAIAASETLDSFSPSPLRDAVGGYLAILRGRPSQADDLLNKAWSAVDPSSDPVTAAGVCQRQVLHALGRFNGRELVLWAERALQLAPPGSPPAVESQVILGLGLGAMGRYEEAERSYHATDHLPEYNAQHQRNAMGRGWLYQAMDRLEEARPMLAIAVPTEFGHGSQRISLWAQAWLARVDVAMGAWDDALRTVDHAAAVVEEAGIELLRPLVHWSGAQIQALRGNWAAADRHLERGAAAADSYPVMLLPSCLAQAQVAETKADYDGVIRALAPVLRMQRASGIDEPGFWPWQDHYANALVMVGRVQEADEFLLPHEELASRRNHRSTLARLSYVRGRIQAATGDLDAARGTFLGGLAQLDTLPMPYARARIKFAYGQSFRRAGKRREAAEALAEARSLFAVLGAEAYVNRCSREMRASGVSSAGTTELGPSRTDSSGAGPGGNLTEQEKSIAALVASGISNKEAAAELYVSVKTVQYHLTRIYMKMGISSRSELAAVYSSQKEVK